MLCCILCGGGHIKTERVRRRIDGVLNGSDVANSKGSQKRPKKAGRLAVCPKNKNFSSKVWNVWKDNIV